MIFEDNARHRLVVDDFSSDGVAFLRTDYFDDERGAYVEGGNPDVTQHGARLLQERFGRIAAFLARIEQEGPDAAHAARREMASWDHTGSQTRTHAGPPMPRALPPPAPVESENTNPTRIVGGLRLSIHAGEPGEAEEYSVARATRDYNLRLEEGEWTVDVFVSAIQDANKAHLRTFSEDTLEEAVEAILEDHRWPRCGTCGSTRGPGPDPDSPCVTCYVGAPCCGGPIEVAGPLYGQDGHATRCGSCSTVFTEPHPIGPLDRSTRGSYEDLNEGA